MGWGGWSRVWVWEEVCVDEYMEGCVDEYMGYVYTYMFVYFCIYF